MLSHTLAVQSGADYYYRFFADEAAAPHTLVCFESPFRVGHCLKAALDELGDREAAVCI